jgi:hypothetical protein
LGHSFGVVPIANPTNLKNFGINSSGYFYIKIESNNKQTTEIIPSINSSTNDTTFAFDLTSKQIIDAIAPIFKVSQRNSIYSAVLKFIVKNAFGEEVSTQQDFKMDFKESAILREYSIYPSKYSGYPVNQWKYLKEGMNLNGTFRVESYNTGVTGQIDIKRGDEAWQTLANLTFSKTGSDASSGAPATYVLTDKNI